MQRFLALITLFFTLFVGNAQTVTIGTGTHLGSDNTGWLPINPYYGYSYSQTIYRADDINASGTITAIKYHFNGSSMTNSRVLKVYMRETSKEGFRDSTDWVTGADNLTLVYDGTITAVTGDAWVNIPLTMPFEYRNEANLLIAVDENDPNFDGENDKFYFTQLADTTDYRSIGIFADEFDPTHINAMPPGFALAGYANIQIEGLTFDCKNPSTPSVSNITRNSASFNWQAPTWTPAPTAYEWKVVSADEDWSSPAIVGGTITGTSITVAGLNINRDYKFYVKTVCASRNIDRFAPPASFSLGCPVITDLPFSENFDTTQINHLPSCWTSSSSISNAPPDWRVEEGTGNQTAKSVSVRTGDSRETRLILPALMLNGNQRLRFAARVRYPNQNNFYGIATYNIILSKTNRGVADFTETLTDTLKMDYADYRETIVDLSAYSGVVHIAIHTTDSEKQWFHQLDFDNITIENTPQCLEPLQLSAPHIRADTAILTWSNRGVMGGRWQVYIGDSATVTPPFSIDSVNGRFYLTDSNKVIVRDLMQLSAYKWWVRRICSAGDTSRWTNWAYFKTPHFCTTPENVRVTVDSTTARFKWNNFTKVEKWFLYYGLKKDVSNPFGSNPAGTFVPAFDSTLLLPNLKYPQLYNFWLLSVCRDSTFDYSDWTETKTFQTIAKNDFCDKAITLPVDTSVVKALLRPTRIAAGTEGRLEDWHYGDNFDTWYKFVAPNDGRKLIIETLNRMDTARNEWILALYDSCGGYARNYQIFAIDDTLGLPQTRLALCPHEYTANATYYLRVFPMGWHAQTHYNDLLIYTDTTTCPVVPPNDVCSAAIPLHVGERLTGSAFLATSQNSAPLTCEPAGKPLYDVWYKFNSGTGDSRLFSAEVVIENTSFSNLLMAVYKGNNCNKLTQILNYFPSECSFMYPNMPRTYVPLAAIEENTDYFVRVWGVDDGPRGEFEIHLRRATPIDSVRADASPSLFECKEGVKDVVIDSSNNSKWVPISDDVNIVAEINANGQNLGTIKTSYFQKFPFPDTPRTWEGQYYHDRNLRLYASQPPTAPVQMRFYFTEDEWENIKFFDSSFTTTHFRLVRMVGDTSCKMDADPTGFRVSRVADAQLKRLKSYDYRVDFTTNELGHFFIMGIPKTEIHYPKARFCQNTPPQYDSLVGPKGGVYTALPAGLNINPTTGTINPALSQAGVYTVSYEIPDLYGGGKVSETITMDASTQIVGQPFTRRVLTVGTPIEIAVSATGTNLTYQWKKNGVDIPNATAATLTLPATAMTDTGTYTVVVIGSCDTVTSNKAIVSNDNGVIVNAKVFLQGAFNTTTGLMNDNLRTLNLIPRIEPYANLTTYTHVNGNFKATLTPSVLTASGNEAVVDWVFLELRSAANPATTVATQSVLVRRDGSMIDAEGRTNIYFGDVPEGSYFVVVRHRNHFGVRTAQALTFVKGVPTAFDFTAATANIYVKPTVATNPPTKNITVAGVEYRTLWTGDVNQDTRIKYNGSANDKGPILVKVGGVLTGVANGYFSEDLNLNGNVKYNGSGNDKGVILTNIGGVLTNVINQHL